MTTSFANVHPFFVHAPLVLIPTAAVLTLLGWRIRQDGYDLAAFLVTIAAALFAIVCVVTGFLAEDTFPMSQAMRAVFEQHRINGVVTTVIASVGALLAIGERLGWISLRLRWVRAAILVWASIGTVFAGHNGATLVYVHGAAVRQARDAARQ